MLEKSGFFHIFYSQVGDWNSEVGNRVRKCRFLMEKFQDMGEHMEKSGDHTAFS